eukprot:jgi/Botrbrau1/9966/Bobra.0012s0061.1
MYMTPAVICRIHIYTWIHMHVYAWLRLEYASHFIQYGQVFQQGCYQQVLACNYLIRRHSHGHVDAFNPDTKGLLAIVMDRRLQSRILPWCTAKKNGGRAGH